MKKTCNNCRYSELLIYDNVTCNWFNDQDKIPHWLIPYFLSKGPPIINNFIKHHCPVWESKDIKKMSLLQNVYIIFKYLVFRK